MHVSDIPRRTDPESPPCTPAASLLTRLGRWSVRQFTAALKPAGIKARHLATLLELRNGPLPQQSLGEAVRVDAAQLVGLLNDLESEGLVNRRRDPEDRRRHIVEISPAGRERLAVVDGALADVDARLMAGLTPEEQTRFVELLRFVAAHGGYDEECAGVADVAPCVVAAEEAGCDSVD
ncbi:MAG: MarR family winged helix-turn-helix transcriptional regulator [Vulcanimicrobiaceae bacterium]